MAEDRSLPYGAPLPAAWLAALQEFVGSAAMNFHLALASPPDRVQVVAGANSAQVGLGIDGLFRYISATITQAVTGVAGAKDIFAVTGPNNLQVNPGGNPPELDQTDYTFAIQILTQGTTPTATSTVTNWRKIGELDWDGTKATGFRVLVGDRDTQAQTAVAPTPNIVAVRAIGAASQVAPLETWEAGGHVVASMDPTGRLTVAGFSSPSVWSAGDLKLSLQAGDHGPRSDGTFDWLLVSAGRRVPSASYPTLFAALGSPPVDGGGTFALPAVNDRALVAAGATYPAGTSMGQASTSLTADQLPHHYHSGTSGVDTPDHTHSGVTGNENQNHAHSGTTAGDYPDHAHYVPGQTAGGGTSGNYADGGAAAVPTGSWSAYSPGASTAGGNFPRSGSPPGSSNLYHSHSVSVNVGAVNTYGANARHQHDFGTSVENAAHNHNFGTGGASARHQHPFTTDGGTSWESGQPLATTGRTPLSLLQPSVAVAVFVKT